MLTEIAGGNAITMPFDEDFQTGDHCETLKRFILNLSYDVEDKSGLHAIWQALTVNWTTQGSVASNPILTIGG